MPHDKTGSKLAVGDIVNVQFKIAAVHESEDACNLNLEFVEPFSDGTTHQTIAYVNSRQCELLTKTISDEEFSELKQVLEVDGNHAGPNR